MNKKSLSTFLLHIMIFGAVLLLISVGSADLNGQSGSGEVVKKPSSPPPPATKTSRASKTSKKAGRSTNPKPANGNSIDVVNSKAVEIAYWDSIKSSANPEDFRAYLRKYPVGEFVDIARNRVESIETARSDSQAAEIRRADMAYWESIKNSSSPGEFQIYLERFPSGLFADIARTRIPSLQAALSEAAERQRVESERVARERAELARVERKIPDTEYSTGLIKSDDGKIHPAKGYHWVNPGDPQNTDVELITGLYRTDNGTLRPKTSYRWVNPFESTDFRVELLPGVTTPVEVPTENMTSFEVIHYHETSMFEEDTSCKGRITIFADGRIQFKSQTESGHDITFTCTGITKLRYPKDFGSEVKFSLNGQKQDFFSSELKSYLQKKCG